MADVLHFGDLVKNIASECGMSQKDADVVTKSVFNQVVAGLKSTGAVNIPGIGRFKTVDKPARSARNPRTGETIQVAAKTKVTFKPAAQLRASF